jgi:hypothetical protein
MKTQGKAGPETLPCNMQSINGTSIIVQTVNPRIVGGVPAAKGEFKVRPGPLSLWLLSRSRLHDKVSNALPFIQCVVIYFHALLFWTVLCLAKYMRGFSFGAQCSLQRSPMLRSTDGYCHTWDAQNGVRCQWIINQKEEITTINKLMSTIDEMKKDLKMIKLVCMPKPSTKY